MTEIHNNKEAARAFAAAFAGALSETLGEALRSPYPLEPMAAGATPTQPGKPIHFRLKVEGCLSGECFVEMYEPQVSELAAKLLGRATVNDEPLEALEKVLASVTPRLRESLAREYADLVLRFERVEGLAFGGMFVVPFEAPADPSGAPVLLYFDSQMLAAFCGAASDRNQPPSIGPGNLKLVMDVELNVSLRFGQRQLPLREVLELAGGSVIELDRMVDEPVELLLDGKLIARGEAIIIDGNYGLRVTEIPQPMANHFLN